MRTLAPTWFCGLPLLALVLGCADASSQLLADLRNDDQETRSNAIRELIQAPQTTDEIVLTLGELSRSQDSELSRIAVAALAKVAPESELAMDAMMKALDSPNSTVRFAAAASLLQIDSGLEAPRQVVLSEIKRVNPRAMILVAELRAGGRWATPALRLLLHHRDESVRELARHALQRVTAE